MSLTGFIGRTLMVAAIVWFTFAGTLHAVRMIEGAADAMGIVFTMLLPTAALLAGGILLSRGERRRDQILVLRIYETPGRYFYR